MPNLPNISQNNEQILNDIQSLQQIEQRLFNNLETNTSLTYQQQQQVIEKMNQLTNMRVNLYQSLEDINSLYDTSLKSSMGALKEQSFAIGIVEDELNRSKKRLELLKSEKNNKIRLVEINEYYGDKYAEHSQLMKIIIFTLIPVIILAILNNTGLIPRAIYNILMFIIIIIGVYFILIRYASIISRDNMNYQEYNFSFDANKAPTGKKSDDSDPWTTPDMYGTCIGEYCCSDNQTYDDNLNKCLATTDKPNIVKTIKESMDNMVNNVLTKTQPGKYKDDVNMGNINYKQSDSFINK